MWTAGSAIAVGLVVPTLLMGACVGRLVGLLSFNAALASGCANACCATHRSVTTARTYTFFPTSVWAWLDPGVMALIGASGYAANANHLPLMDCAAFFAGVTRLSMALTVIMIELSNDVHMLARLA